MIFDTYYESLVYYCEICKKIIPDNEVKDNCCCPNCGHRLRYMHIDDVQYLGEEE
jgi:rRNA maturation endonuclease Nob1